MSAQLPLSSLRGGVDRPAAAAADRSGREMERVPIGTAPPVALVVLERLDLAAIIGTLFACLLTFDESLTVDYGVLAVVAALLGSRLLTPPNLAQILTYGSASSLSMTRLVVEWASVVGVLLLSGFALKISDWYSRSVLLTWFAATPVALIGVQEGQVRVARWLNERGALSVRYVVVGLNKVGRELAERLPKQGFLGFFDFRSAERLAESDPGVPLAGGCSGLADFVRASGVNAVYIALPIGNAPRIRELLTELRNSTASVYFVPDVFSFDLIQARVVDVNGIPALAICDTPLHGTNAFAKRVMDLGLSLLALIATAPLLLGIALAIKLTSRGPVLFRQRRYGLDGEEIVVFKFRTMTVCEDGETVRQASMQDSRVTAIGGMLRRTSLDELPQLVNVVAGTMSLVGPRPHAVAHNEFYRSQISGYMVRHKVRPGITGWAQVHGLRGETDTLDKMAQRVRYDLEYLRNWSLLLDLRILLKTVAVVMRGKNAY